MKLRSPFVCILTDLSEQPQETLDDTNRITIAVYRGKTGVHDESNGWGQNIIDFLSFDLGSVDFTIKKSPSSSPNTRCRFHPSYWAPLCLPPKSDPTASCAVPLGINCNATDTVNLVDPTDHEYPEDPADPADPADLVYPVDPADPVNPVLQPRDPVHYVRSPMVKCLHRQKHTMNRDPQRIYRVLYSYFGSLDLSIERLEENLILELVSSSGTSLELGSSPGTSLGLGSSSGTSLDLGSSPGMPWN